MKTLVCCNVLNQISNAPYMSHCNFWYRLGKLAEKTGYQFMSFFPYRMAIDTARNQAARIALANDCDYLFFYDDDSYINADTFQSLKNANKDIVMAHTFIRTKPFYPMYFKELGQEGNTKALTYDVDGVPDPETGLLEVAAVGFSTCLIKVELLKKIQPPYFLTGSGMTEDVYFCLKAKDKVPDTSIFVDFKVPAGHLLNPEIVSLDNIESLRKFYGAEAKLSNIIDHEAKDILDWISQMKA